MTATAIPVQLTLQQKVARMTRDLDRTMQALRDALQPALRKIGKSMIQLTHDRHLACYLRANEEVHVAGLCARYQVRAGLDPAYASVFGLDVLVACILAGDEDEAEGLFYLSRANRVLVAAAAMRGWVESYAGRTAAPVLVAHRLWGTTAVEVSCG